jgi:hypothetical protein
MSLLIPLPINYSELQNFDNIEPNKVVYQLDHNEAGTFSLRSDKFEKIANNIPLSKMSEQVRKSIKLYLDLANSKTSNKVIDRDFTSSKQYQLELFSQNIYKNPEYASNYINLKFYLNNLLTEGRDKLSVEEKNQIYLILTSINNIDRKPQSLQNLRNEFNFGRSVSLKTEKYNLSIVSDSKVENQGIILPNKAEVDFFDNVLVSRFYNWDKKLVNTLNITSFCNQERSKCQDYLRFMISYQSKLRGIKGFEFQNVILQQLINNFNQVIRVTK